MTACNIFIAPHEARIFTDGAWLREDGALDHCRPKVLLVPHLHAVITTQGGSDLPALIGPHFERLFATFDDMVAGASAFMREPPEALRPYLSMPVFARQRVALVGYSEEAGRMRGFYLQSMEEAGLPAWEVAPVDQWVSPPAPASEARLHPNGGLISPSLAVEMMEEQRGFVWDIGNGTEVPSVGGFCQMTVVTQDEITTGILWRWPDRIGEKLAA
jgi:hypothetical protein